MMPTSDALEGARPYLQHDVLAVTNADALRVAVCGFSTSAIVIVRGRLLAFDGQISPFEFRITPAVARVFNSSDFPLAEGFLLNVSARLSATGPALGQIFIRIDLIRGSGSPAIELATLAQGPVGFSQALSWPGSPHRNTLDAPGYLRAITGTNPGAGAEVSETVPTGARWELLSLAVALVTSAAVANRFPMLQLDDGANTYAQSSVAAAITASTTALITAGDIGAPIAATALGFTISIPAGVILSAGHRIRTLTTNLQGADDYGAPIYLVRETLEGA
jgi:hypothetical protein